MDGINIDSKLLDALQASTCFGIAYDDVVPECKQCDVREQCRVKATGGGADIPTPNGREIPADENVKPTSKPSKPAPAAKAASVKKAEASLAKPKKAAAPKKADKPVKPVNPNMPNFKEMSWTELTDLATKFGVTPKDYKSEAINRMRLIMELKKHY